MEDEKREFMYEPEERWQQIVVSVGREDKQLKAALRKLANDEDRNMSKQACLIFREYLRERGRL